MRGCKASPRVNKYELYTVKKVFDRGLYTVKITQQYNKLYDRGHYAGYIEHCNGNIVNVFETTAGAPDGRVNQKTLSEHFQDWKRRNREDS